LHSSASGSAASKKENNNKKTEQPEVVRSFSADLGWSFSHFPSYQKTRIIQKSCFAKKMKRTRIGQTLVFFHLVFFFFFFFQQTQNCKHFMDFFLAKMRAILAWKLLVHRFL
jgi:hypothetical protein